MSSQIFNFPGFFDREVDLSSRAQEPVGIPAGIVGSSERGPAFVPVTVGSFSDWGTKFGDLNFRHVSTYAVNEHLKNRTALTFIRVLGAGGNTTATHIETTRVQGTVNNAGFKISASLTPSGSELIHGGAHGAVQFLLARHVVSSSEAYAQAGFTNNNSFFTTGSADEVMLVRGVIFASSGTRIQVMSHNEAWSTSLDDAATANSTNRKFKIAISSSAGLSFSSDEGQPGIRILTASLDPSSDDYFAKILNTDPESFNEQKHYVYADYAVDSVVAQVATGSGDVVVASGSSNASSTSGDSALPFLNSFGRFDTRYQNAKTPSFISQPFGDVEHDLFHFEAIDDGEYPNKKFKVSILAIKKSSNPRNKFGSFSVAVRAFDDTDTDPAILEQYNDVNLDPSSDSYIAKAIGDRKGFFNFDAENEEDKRLVATGRFPSKSKILRVIMNEDVEKGLVPDECLPFGFRGLDALSTNSRLVDRSGSLAGFSAIKRLHANLGGVGDEEILAALIPPVPYRFKVTRGDISTDPNRLEGAPGNLEVVDARYFWGIKGERIKSVLNPNTSNEPNELVSSYAQFNGISKLDVLVTGSKNKDDLHNHKFTLAKVAFGNTSLSNLTSSVNVHMKEAAYLRNAVPDITDYKVADADGTQRITMATLLNKGSNAAVFNSYSGFAKFTCIMQGGFDGVNILDKHAATLDDRSTSTEGRSDGTYGNVHGSFVSPGFDYNQNGTGLANNSVNSYREAARIITDSIASNVNVVAVPGQRDSQVTDYYADKTRDFGLALYVMDLPNYDASGGRIFDGETSLHTDPQKVANSLESRAIDNEFAASYYPDVVIDDETNGRRVVVPASVAAVSALSFNDRVSYPWFAPAGFNRASLDFVVRTTARINQPERVRMYDVHVNPIVKFPREGNVIFAQNTLEQAGSALGSVNVVRMLNDVKRQIIDIGNRLIWENITPELRKQLADKIKPVLSTTQIKQGIERYSVTCDDTNNTSADVDANKMNCRIVLVPTRTAEFIAIDFIITRSGVQFKN
jgi:hypothetical protein